MIVTKEVMKMFTRLKGLRIPICRQCSDRFIRGKAIRIAGIVFTLFFLQGLIEVHSGTIEVVAARIEGNPGDRIVALEFTEAVNYRFFTLENPPRVVVDVSGITLKEPRTIEVRNEVIETINYRQHQPDIIRIAVNLTQPVESRIRKVGRELQLHLSLPREARARLQAEERARQLFTQRLKEETKLKSREVALEKEQALEVAQRREREKKRQLGTHLGQGESYLRAQRFDAAIREFEAVLILDPENEKAQNSLVLSEEKKNAQLLLQARVAREEREREEKEQRREEEMRQEKRREERIAEHLRRGRAYYLQERYREAISEGERVLAFSPDNRRAEDLITRSWRQKLERDKRRAQKEREIEEKRRILDVTRASFTSPADYLGGIRPRRDRDVADLSLEDDPGDMVDTLRKRAKEIMVTMDFRATDIREVLLHLARLSEVTIAMDERALAELADPYVTIFTPTSIPLTDALSIILRVKGLGYAIKEHYIWVAEAGREEEAVTRIFPLKYGIRRIREIAPILLEDILGDDH